MKNLVRAVAVAVLVVGLLPGVASGVVSVDETAGAAAAPIPGLYAANVLVDGLPLTWAAALDPATGYLWAALGHGGVVAYDHVGNTWCRSRTVMTTTRPHIQHRSRWSTGRSTSLRLAPTEFTCSIRQGAIAAAGAASGRAPANSSNRADTIFGGPGKDHIRGGEHNDTLRGLDGPDSILGELGADTIEGNKGNDTILGHNGDDRLFGGLGTDVCNGNLGVDTAAGCETTSGIL